MYSLRFSKTYDFGIMERNKIDHVLEDKFYADDNVFCIADGVTRDFTDGTAMHYPKNMDDVKEILEKYPNPSGAAKAAEICVKDIVQYLKKKKESKVTDKDIESAVEYANNDINKINADRDIDYISEDKYSCVSVGGIICDNVIRSYSIGDAGIMTYDKDFNILFDSTNKLVDKPDVFLTLGHKLFPKLFNYKHNFYRKHFRKNVRNNLLLKFFHRNNVGILNGDKKAIKFVTLYDISLDNVKYIFVFSDGCQDLISTPEKAKNVYENPESIKYGECEKTLIIYEKVL